VALGVAGCLPFGGGSAPDAPVPVPHPSTPLLAEVDRSGTLAPALPRAPEVLPSDPILHSRWARHPEIRAAAGRWVEVFTRRNAEGFPVWLDRLQHYSLLVDSTLEARGLPRSLRYLPIIESGYRPGAVSRVSAVGMWQFMAPVARSFGMTVSSVVDERRDPVKSTAGALTYLEELHARFDSWFLALAAYNGGPYRVERLLREHAPLAARSDSLFPVIAPHLPRETREFVPKFLAAATVAEAPGRFGLRRAGQTERFAFDEVEVPDATSLDVVARAAGVAEAEIRTLNPQLVRGITPRGKATRLRVPPGRGAAFLEAYARIPPEERITVTEHVVSRGESFWTIARLYGIRSAELRGANPRIDPRRLQIGTRLLVPLVPGTRGRRSASSPAPGPVPDTHTVRRGESLWTIARRYRVTVRQLRVWNRLREGAVLQPGDLLRLQGS
jgi:membrane-bound lytic murein transglycosylase D